MNNKFFKYLTVFAIAISSFSLFAANYTINTSADIDVQCYAVGDTVTIADSSASAVLGDGIATIDNNVITMKHSGVTLLKSTDGVEYSFCVYETPATTGDVFFLELTSSNLNWESDVWTKITSNTDRTYPNSADDVAIVLSRTSDYRYLNIVGEGVTVGQLIRGEARTFTIAQASGATRYLKFARTDGIASKLVVSHPNSVVVEGTVQVRMGEHDRDDSGYVLAISFDGPSFEIDFAGDSLAAPSYSRSRYITCCIGRASLTVNEGQVVRVLNGSRMTYKKRADHLYLHDRKGSGVFGDGVVEILDVSANFKNGKETFKPAKLKILTGYDKYGPDSNLNLFGVDFKTIPSDVDVEVLSGRCPTNVTHYASLYNQWDVGEDDGILADSILVSGAYFESRLNGAYAPHADYYQATNTIENLTIRGHVTFFSNSSYNPDGGHLDENGVQRGRVTTHFRAENMNLFDKWTTASANGYNFNRGDTRTNEIRGTLEIGNWEEFIVRPEGVDPADYDGTVYAIIPWMTVHCNDNSQAVTDTDWGQEHTFPGVNVENGALRLNMSLNNKGEQDLSKRGENDNFYFSNKSGFNLNGSDRRLFSLVYCTGESPHYATGGNFYFDTSKGGHKLYITSGAMAIIRNNNWLGQPVDMTRNGKIVLERSPSYLHVTSGLYYPTLTSQVDFNIVWIPIVATNDLIKGGAGSVGLAGDQRGIKGTLVINGGEVYLGYPKYKKNGYLYNCANPEKGWEMHGVAMDCSFRVRGGAVLAIASSGYNGVDSDGNEVNEPVIAYGKDKRNTITLERSGLTVGSVEIPEEETAVSIYKLYVQDENGEEVTLARGTWGSSLSAAEFVDDTLFAGEGVIKVLSDDLLRPTTIIIK